MGKSSRTQLPKHTTPTAAGADPARRGERVRQLVAEGARLLAARRPGEAISPLEEARRLAPADVLAAINLGGAYILQGKHARAVPVLEQAAALEPDNAMLWSNLAAAYLGKLPFSTTDLQDRAITAYQRALALDPRAPHVHYNLGLIYLERHNAAQAAACFRAALETDPGDADASRWLARLTSEQ
jgi:Flp pilus assembly protein TadD